MVCSGKFKSSTENREENKRKWETERERKTENEHDMLIPLAAWLRVCFIFIWIYSYLNGLNPDTSSFFCLSIKYTTHIIFWDVCQRQRILLKKIEENSQSEFSHLWNSWWYWSWSNGKRCIFLGQQYCFNIQSTNKEKFVWVPEVNWTESAN